MAEIARHAVLFGGADMVAAEAEATAVLAALKETGAGNEAEMANLSRKVGASLGEAESVTIVLCSTGDGAQDVGFDRFWRFLKRSSARLERLKFAVLDVGDGAVGAAVSAALSGLGATDVAPAAADPAAFRAAVAAAMPAAAGDDDVAAAAAAATDGAPRVLAVLYGSETGNANYIAHAIGAAARERAPKCGVVVAPLDGWKDRYQAVWNPNRFKIPST